MLRCKAQAMRLRFRQAITATLVLSIITLAGGGRTGAQQDDRPGRTGSRVDLSPRVASVKNSPKRITKAPVRIVPIIKYVEKKPTTGAISVSAEANAVILVEPLALKGGRKGRREAQQGAVPERERQFYFADLQPGSYRVAAELDGYHPAETVAEVKASETKLVTLDLRPKVYAVAINLTNLSTGEVRYITGDGPERLVPVRNGRAVLNNLLPGKYEIDIRPGEVGYQTYFATVSLPSEKAEFNIELKRVLSEETFYDTWINLDGWDAPGKWRIDSNKLLVNEPGVALPHAESYRYYTDFQLLSDVRMLNGAAVSFVVRAVDKKNYYLVQLTGPDASPSYVLRGFVVKDGIARSLQAPIKIDHFAEAIKPDKFFTLFIKMIDNKIDVKIRDRETGELRSLGIMTDADRNFPIGAIGIAARDREQFQLRRFIVCLPARCPRE